MKHYFIGLFFFITFSTSLFAVNTTVGDQSLATSTEHSSTEKEIGRLETGKIWNQLVGKFIPKKKDVKKRKSIKKMHLKTFLVSLASSISCFLLAYYINEKRSYSDIITILISLGILFFIVSYIYGLAWLMLPEIV